MHKNQIDVSVLVLTYNSDIIKIYRTLKSIIIQKGVACQIVICDDGSKENHAKEIEKFFNDNNFFEYVFVLNEDNRGTVYNYYSGLLSCDGTYVKAISPGDILYGDHCLLNWIEYLKKSNCEWSFSETIYCSSTDDKELKVVSVQAHPYHKRMYQKHDKALSRRQYFVFSDVAVGASIIGKKDIQIHYISEILGKVIYAEDNIWRIAMFDGKDGAFYNRHTILYEYGTGISTQKSALWTDRIQKDWLATDLIIKSRKDIDDFQEHMLKDYQIISSSKKINKLFVSGYFSNRIVLFKRRKTISRLPVNE